jgi:hypothetical protein
MFQAIDIDLGGDISRFPQKLEEVVETTRDVDMACFYCIKYSEEKTLSFFRLMPDVASAVSFRKYFSSRTVAEQNFLLLFLTSGLRWRFYCASSRGSSCPFCSAHFWSWEHFVSCPMFPVRFSVPEMTALIVLNAWVEIADHVKRVVQLWQGEFDLGELNLKPADIAGLFN